jgi:3',5'-nucleoside bisphosphate phosphatase
MPNQPIDQPARAVVADLHNHSTASDGEYSPTDLVHAAHALGLQAVALTDHDTLDGLDEALAAGRAVGMRVIPGVEITLRFHRPQFTGSLHLLLYFSESLFRRGDFRAAMDTLFPQGRGPALVRARVAAINRVFGPEGTQPLLTHPLVAETILSYGETITRRHFALALQEHHGLDREQVNQLIGNKSPAYIPSGVEMQDVRPLVTQFPVVRVLAHPAAGSFPGESHYKEVLPPLETVEQLLPEFLDPAILGLDGLEVSYPGHTPPHRDVLRDWARQYGLLVTGGSDCHDQTHRPLGVEGMTQEELDRLIQALEPNGL